MGDTPDSLSEMQYVHFHEGVAVDLEVGRVILEHACELGYFQPVAEFFAGSFVFERCRGKDLLKK